jgi:putative hydrolase of HD superfamily
MQTNGAEMRADEIEGVLAFLRAAERLKTVVRSGWTSAGESESVAEHTWRLCLMAMLLYGHAPGIDLARLLKMCLIHDRERHFGGTCRPRLSSPEGTRRARNGVTSWS